MNETAVYDVSDTEISSSIADNLRRYIKLKRMNSRNLAERAHVKPSFIYDILNGKSQNPSTVKLARVAEALGVSVTDLLVQQKEGGVPRVIEHLANHHQLVAHLAVEEALGMKRIAKQPFSESPIAVSRHWMHANGIAYSETLATVRIEGDHMRPTINHDSIVVIDQARKTPESGGVYVIFDGQHLHAKRLEVDCSHGSSKLWVYNDNRKYGHYQCELSNLHIVGKVLACLCQL